MNNGINLISYKRAGLEKQEKVVRIFNRVAYGSLTVVALISISLFLLNYYSPMNKLQTQQQEVTQTLLAQKSKIAKLLLLRDRIHNIDAIYLQNTSLEKTLTAVALNTPGDVSVDSLGISKDGVSMILTSPSLVSINTFMDFLDAQVAKKLLFKKVTISSLSLDVKSARYTLSIAATPL